ncbi:MAG: CpXC domain-containing protein [Aquabacterium sp.]|jgi:hypothetical protein|uniref:CpXC domain-containing protein n=1 Tax=Aquabacterium sp. TaxID=1872578 RepID=UPI003BB0035C
MSIFRSLNVTCPACGKDFVMQAAESVNADRRPDLRDAILDGSFQVEACPHCGERFRLDPRLSYVDIARGQWISVQPLEDVGDWVAGEDEAIAMFDKAYGSQAPASAREIGEALRLRLVYGWSALREKLVVAEHGLDDVTLELMKLALIQGLDHAPLARGNELRLETADPESLELRWVKAESDEVIERLRVPRSLYDGIVDDEAAWAALRQSTAEGPFVDMQKQYLGQGRQA